MVQTFRFSASRWTPVDHGASGADSRQGTGDADGHSQVTQAEYDRMLSEAKDEGTWGVVDAGIYATQKAVNRSPRETNLAAHKDDWVRNHSTLINVTARRHGIPPEVLAGIAHTETGGMPDIGDNAMNYVRGVTNELPQFVKSTLGQRLAGPPENISAGDTSIQLRNAAKLDGIDPTTLDRAGRAKLISRLQDDKAYALDVTARYVKDSLVQAYPGYQGGPLSDKQVMAAGYAYNLGYPHSGVDPQNPNPVKVGNSSYGPDLARKLGRMRELLGRGN